MRGTHQRQGEGRDNPGIIPAYAGNTDILPLSARGYRDHPRVCGEHMMSLRFMPCDPGSSPRMRGTLADHVTPLRYRGIIPAYAGNTYSAYQTAIAAGDHPRVCGEHFTYRDGLTTLQGSSPRMRGTLNPSTPEIDQTGIIPAYAGNTSWRTVRSRCRRDHPRVCGEHQDFTPSDENTWGSSPRMRGTHMGLPSLPR